MEQNPFEQHTPEHQECQKMKILDQGHHLVTIELIEFTSDAIKLKDEPDDPGAVHRDWDDENAVMYVYLTSPDGVLHYRFYWNGYVKWDQVRDKPDKYRPPKSALVRQHAIDIKTNCRVVDPTKSKIARKYLNQFCTAAGITGKSMSELAGKQLWIELVKKKLFGNTVNQIIAVAPKDEGFDYPPRNSEVNMNVKPKLLDDQPIDGAF